MNTLQGKQILYCLCMFVVNADDLQWLLKLMLVCLFFFVDTRKHMCACAQLVTISTNQVGNVKAGNSLENKAEV